MGFLDKAKAAANDLANKADTALSSSGLGGTGYSTEKLFRDLGVIAYLEATGRQAPAGERERIMGTLREAEQHGAVPSFALLTPAPQPGTGPVPPGTVPPPPGAAAQQAPAAPQMAPPPPGAPVPQAPVPPTAPPPPPPSWMKSDDA